MSSPPLARGISRGHHQRIRLEAKGTAPRARLSKERDGHCQVGLNRDSSLVRRPLTRSSGRGGRGGRCHQPWQAKLELPAAAPPRRQQRATNAASILSMSNAPMPTSHSGRGRSRAAEDKTFERLMPPTRKMRRDRSQRLSTTVARCSGRRPNRSQ